MITGNNNKSVFVIFGKIQGNTHSIIERFDLAYQTGRGIGVSCPVYF